MGLKDLWRGAPRRPEHVLLVGVHTQMDVTRRLVYVGWRNNAHAWQLALSEDEHDLVLAQRLMLKVGKLHGRAGFVLTMEDTELPDGDFPPI